MTDLSRLSDALLDVETSNVEVQEALRVIHEWLDGGGDAVDTTARASVTMEVPWSREDCAPDGPITMWVGDADAPNVSVRDDTWTSPPDDESQCHYWREFISNLVGQVVTTDNGYTITFE